MALACFGPMAARWSAGQTDSDSGVRVLIGQLVQEVGSLAEQTLALLKLECRKSLAGLVRHLSLMVIGVLGLVLGVLLLVIALALWVGGLLGSTSGGFAVIGGGATLASLLLGGMGLSGLRRLRLYPEMTLRELRKDLAWLQGDRPHARSPVRGVR